MTYLTLDLSGKSKSRTTSEMRWHSVVISRFRWAAEGLASHARALFPGSVKKSYRKQRKSFHQSHLRLQLMSGWCQFSHTTSHLFKKLLVSKLWLAVGVIQFRRRLFPTRVREETLLSFQTPSSTGVIQPGFSVPPVKQRVHMRAHFPRWNYFQLGRAENPAVSSSFCIRQSPLPR